MNTPTKLSAKLTFDDVKEIKALIWNGQSQTEVAKVFNVTQPNINRIVHGYIWQEVPWPNMAKGALNMEDYIRRMEGFGFRTKRGIVELPPMVQPVTPEEIEGLTKEPPTELTPQQREDRNKMAADIMTKRGEQAEADMELEIAEATQAHAKTARKGKKKTPKKTITAKNIPWKRVQSRAPRNPMVVLAQVDKDLRKCICIAFRALPETMWNTPKAEAVVKEVGINLGIEIKGNFFKQKE